MNKQRERWPDFLRAFSIIFVVIFHVAEPLRSELSYVPRMGFLFAIGSLFVVGSLGRSVKTTLHTRSKRILVPMWAFAAVAMPVLALAGWTPSLAEASRLILPYATPTAPEAGMWADIVAPLWFITVYIWFVLLSPLLLKAFRRAPYIATLAPIAVLAFIYLEGHADQLWQLLGYGGALTFFMFLVHLPCWMVGFARREGMLQAHGWRTILSVGGVLLGAGVLITILKHGSNPTIYDPANAIYMLGFTLIVMRANPKMDWLPKIKPLYKSVRFLNQRAMTTYLWHCLIFYLIGTYVVWPNLWKLGLAPGLEAPLEVLVSVILTLVALTIPWLLFGWIEDHAANRKLMLWPEMRLPRPIKYKVPSVRRLSVARK